MHTPGDGAALEQSVEEIEFLVRSAHRVGVLAALSEEPCDRAELCEATEASSPTMGRVLADFEERGWVVRDGRIYELTRLGEFVAEELVEFCKSMATERKLRDVWRWLPSEMSRFDVELFEDAVVSYPGPGYPSQPLERIAELVGGTESLRGFGATVVKSNNLEAAFTRILNGMEAEYVYDPAVFEAVYSWNPELVTEATALENCTHLVHDSLPDGDRCGLVILDERVAICCHDGPVGALRAVVDTDSPAAREWADSVYQQVRNDARLVEDPESFLSLDRPT
ncbi:helix-turn-helix transcriptional regulator [Salinigranum salinum]|uniref:helix-turn-helix transcriptional regulator n=1 Tax=Salinigranum salinum TaxID=1364937 RepID=UPI001260F207|nr:transcriptional regulator [Salinigranum salinum]